jgi:hypothetical protein
MKEVYVTKHPPLSVLYYHSQLMADTVEAFIEYVPCGNIRKKHGMSSNICAKAVCSRPHHRLQDGNIYKAQRGQVSEFNSGAR